MQARDDRPKQRNLALILLAILTGGLCAALAAGMLAALVKGLGSSDSAPVAPTNRQSQERPR